MSINIAGIICTVTGKWNHPRSYSGACVLGNLLLAILMRNELFGRFLYLIVNTCFAKVVLGFCFPLIYLLMTFPVAASLVSPNLHLNTATPWWHPFRVCYLRIFVARVSRGPDFYGPRGLPHVYIGNWTSYRCRRGDFHGFRISMGTKHTSQASQDTQTHVSLSDRVADSIFERHHRFVGWWVLHFRRSANPSNLNPKDRSSVQYDTFYPHILA